MRVSEHYLFSIGYLPRNKSSTFEDSDLIMDQPVVPVEEIGKDAVSYEEADEKEAYDMKLAF